MKAVLAAFAAGLVFAIGLALAGMTQPGKVVAFLDLFGRWDPSLAFVMGGAIAVYAVAYRLIRRRATPVLDPTFHLPTKTRIEPRLMTGAALFGIGWGIAGYCPGPALTSLASGSRSAVILVAAMIVGMLLEQAYEAFVDSRRKAPTREIARRPSGSIAA